MVLALGCGCSPSSGADGGLGGGAGGGTGGAGGGAEVTPFVVSWLDETARDATTFAMAIDTATDRVGVAYYTPSSSNSMQGVPDFDLKYLEWRAGVVSAPQTIRFVQRKVGLSVAFNRATGEPMVAYLGGDQGFAAGQSLFWFQSDAALAVRTNGTTWTEQRIATGGAQIPCGNGTSDRGFLVGLWPSIAYDAAGNFLYVYRDGHDGEFPLQDWNASDVEVWSGATPATATTGTCVAAGGDNKQAWGGHLQLVASPTETGLIFDQMFSSADTKGQNVVFQERSPAGNWSAPAAVASISDTQTGASLAWDSAEGFGFAVVDLGGNGNRLSYFNRSPVGNPMRKWGAEDPVFGAGSGGWYPSLAMDPVHHEPAIAFYVCSPRASVSPTDCLTSEDDLRVSQRISGQWRETPVDFGGGYAPKLGFLSSGKRVVVSRVPPAKEAGSGATVPNVGALKIAVER